MVTIQLFCIIHVVRDLLYKTVILCITISVVHLHYFQSSWDSFTVVSTSCPPGYVLSAAPLQGNMSTTCACDNNDSSILGCNGRSIILKVSRLYTSDWQLHMYVIFLSFTQDGLWGTQDMSQQLVTYPCPPQYCQCALGVQGRTATCSFTFDSLDSDSQCNCDREGGPKSLCHHVLSLSKYVHVIILYITHADQPTN